MNAPERKDVEDSRASLTRMLLLPVCLLGCTIVVSHVAIGLFMDTDAWIAPSQRIVSIAMMLLVALWVLVALRHLPATRWDWLFRVSWTVLASVAVMGIVLLVPDDAGSRTMGLGILGAAVDCLDVFLWINLVLATKEHGTSSVMVFGLAFATFKMLPLLLGKVIGPMPSPVMDGVFPPTAIVMVLVLTLSTDVYLGSAVVRVHENTNDTRHEDCRGEILGQIANDFKLTARELEVLDYRSQGYGYQAIGNSLGISTSTAQGYSKSLFKKMDVHSKQDLAAIVHERSQAK